MIIDGLLFILSTAHTDYNLKPHDISIFGGTQLLCLCHSCSWHLIQSHHEEMSEIIWYTNTKICKYFKKNWTSMNIKILNIVEETKLLPRQVLTRAIERDLCKNRTKINHNKICSLWCIGKFPKHNIQSRTFIYFSDKHLASPYVLCLGEHGTCRLGNIFLQAHFISSIKHISIDFYVLFCSVPLPFE